MNEPTLANTPACHTLRCSTFIGRITLPEYGELCSRSETPLPLVHRSDGPIQGGEAARRRSRRRRSIVPKHLSGEARQKKYYGKSRRARLAFRDHPPFFTKGSFALADVVGSKEKRGSGIIVTARRICCRGLPANGACQAIGNSLPYIRLVQVSSSFCTAARSVGPTAPTVGTAWELVLRTTPFERVIDLLHV